MGRLLHLGQPLAKYPCGFAIFRCAIISAQAME